MKALTAGLAAALAFAASPAFAILQIGGDVSGVSFFCADNTVCDLNPTIGILQIADGSLNGVEVNGSIQAAGFRSLNTSSLSVINTGILSKTVTVAVSDTDFIGGTGHVSWSGSGVWQGPIGSTATLKWFDDPTNTQGASTGTDTPGSLLDSFTHTSTLNPDAFSTNGSAVFGNAGPFSLTEQASFTLKGGSELVSRGQAIEAVPELSTWAMLGVGFGLMGLVGGKRARSRLHVA